MLFNSYEFLFLFLPVTLIVYGLVIRTRGLAPAVGWLVFASLFFYGWWAPVYVWLILASMAFNFTLGRVLDKARRRDRQGMATLLLTVGVTANLGALGYFKYAMLLADTVNAVAGTALDVGTIILPLAISFFTFQQIAFLVDSRRGLCADYSPMSYALFVCFFPQLIAGPIVHHHEMMPQFTREAFREDRARDISVGVTMLIIGLFKKAVLADGVAPYANDAFGSRGCG